MEFSFDNAQVCLALLSKDQEPFETNKQLQRLEETDLAMIVSLVVFLEPFEFATKVLDDENQPTIHQMCQ